MRFKIALILAVLALSSLPAWSQDEEFQAAANLTANLQSQTNASGVTDTATYSGGLLLNLRYRFHPHLYFEANGGFTTFTQYYQPVASQEQANIYEASGAVIYNFRDPVAKVKPFIEAGGGILYFSPVATGSTPGGSKQIQPAVVAGFGLDYKISPRYSVRAGYRSMFYKPASFKIASQTVNTITEMAEPYIGIVLRF